MIILNNKLFKQFVSVLTIVLLSMCWISPVSAIDTQPNSAELVINSKVVLLGTIVDSSCEYRDEVIFTINNVDVEKIYKGDIFEEESIKIQQLGGTIGDITIPHLPGITTYEVGERYILFLYPVYENDDVFYEAVGNYGVKFSELNLRDNATIIEIEYAIDLLESSSSNQVQSVMSSGGLYNGSWNLSEVDAYVQYSINTNYSTTLYNWIKYGITSWNGQSALTVATKNAASACEVFVYMGSYNLSQYSSSGISGDVTAATVYQTGGATGTNPNEYPYIKAYIYLNKDAMNTGYYSSWRAVVCHEMGHALGLAHSDGNGYYSIMKSATSDYFNGYCSYAPTSGDINLLQYKYGT